MIISWFAATIALVAIGLAWGSSLDPHWTALLEYRRDAVARGEFWRLLAAHLIHLSGAHALLDVGGLLLVAWIFGDEFGWRTEATVCAVGVVAIDAALWAMRIDRYAGLSGVLHAWFASGVACWLLARRDRCMPAHDVVMRKRVWGAVLSIGLVAKLVLELRHQAFWLDGTPYPVVTAAHRWGAVAGAACGVCVAVLRRRARAGVAGSASRVR